MKLTWMRMRIDIVYRVDSKENMMIIHNSVIDTDTDMRSIHIREEDGLILLTSAVVRKDLSQDEWCMVCCVIE